MQRSCRQSNKLCRGSAISCSSSEVARAVRYKRLHIAGHNVVEHLGGPAGRHQAGERAAGQRDLGPFLQDALNLLQNGASRGELGHLLLLHRRGWCRREHNLCGCILLRSLVHVLEGRGHTGRQGYLGRVEWRHHNLWLGLRNAKLVLRNRLGRQRERDCGHCGRMLLLLHGLWRGHNGNGLGGRGSGSGSTGGQHPHRRGRRHNGDLVTRRGLNRSGGGRGGGGHCHSGRRVRVAVVVGGLVLPQLALVSVTAATGTTHKRLLSGVDANMGNVALAPQESLTAGGTLVGQVSRVSPGVSVQLTPISEAFFAQAALKRSLSCNVRFIIFNILFTYNTIFKPLAKLQDLMVWHFLINSKYLYFNYLN